MFIISDTNILSSFAAGEALFLLARLFPNSRIYIPPMVQAEIKVGLTRGKTHLAVVLQAIEAKQIEILALSSPEKYLSQNLPDGLNPGECEAIALAEQRHGRLLSNDRQAVRYCHQQNIQVLDLVDLLRLLWLKQVISKDGVKRLIQKMEQVEKLKLKSEQLATIFAPRRT